MSPPSDDPLAALRAQIDSLDDRLRELLEQRTELAGEVGKVKARYDLPIFVPERQEELLRRLSERRNPKLLTEESVRAIWREIISAALAIEKKLRIAYLGPEGTWSHQAARLRFGAGVEYVAAAGIPDVFAEVERGRADLGVVPIENSTEGAVTYTLDQLVESDLKVCAQVDLMIEHNLAAKCERSAIRVIGSHPQVLGQCREWLRHHFPHAEIRESSSTTRAAELASKEEATAAICSAMAAELYGLTIWEAGVQDLQGNTTRFLVLGRQDCRPTGRDKTSMVFGVRDRAGALYAALEPFSRLGISLTKIESRPSRRRKWEYIFFVDVLAHRDDPALAEALQAVENHCDFLKVLGSYPDTTDRG